MSAYRCAKMTDGLTTAFSGRRARTCGVVTENLRAPAAAEAWRWAERGMAFSKKPAVALLLALFAVYGSLAGDTPSCEPRILARCSIDMPFDAIREMFPTGEVEPQKNGTRALTVRVSDPFPHFSTSGILRITFDQRLVVEKVSFSSDVTGTETRARTATESAWGDSRGVSVTDYVTDSSGKAQSSSEEEWGESCNSFGRLYVSSSGPPWLISATWVLIRMTP